MRGGRTARAGWRAGCLVAALAWAAGAAAADITSRSDVSGRDVTGGDARPRGATAVRAAAGPQFLGGILTETRVLYPLHVDGWVAESEQRYPEQQQGVSVRFIGNRKGRWIDLYFYPAGMQAANNAAALAAGERDGIADAAREEGRSATLGELESFRLPRGSAGAGVDAARAMVPAWRLGLAYPDEGVASAMLLFVQDLYVVKARASAVRQAGGVRALQQELQAFMESIAGQLKIVSTGACWLPDRTDIAGVLPAVDGEAVLASYREPGRDVAAVALADRVVVARAEAARAPELATRLAQTLYPGCVAPEAIEPEVPAPLREIRIEYRVPDAADGPVRGPRIAPPGVLAWPPVALGAPANAEAGAMAMSVLHRGRSPRRSATHGMPAAAIEARLPEVRGA